MSTQSLTSDKSYPQMKYRKLIVKGNEKKKTHFLLGLMPADFDMEYFAKTKKLEPQAEWDEKFVPPRDRELVEKNQIFYFERAVTGEVVTVKQLFGAPVDDLSKLYGHVVPENTPKTRIRQRVKKDEPRTRTRSRSRPSEEPRKRTRKRKAV